METKNYEIVKCECEHECPVDFAIIDEDANYICPNCYIERLNSIKTRILFKAKLISTGEWVKGTYHYSSDGKYHYILSRECFLERTYDTGNEMALKKQEVHLVNGDTVTQIIN